MVQTIGVVGHFVIALHFFFFFNSEKSGDALIHSCPPFYEEEERERRWSRRRRGRRRVYICIHWYSYIPYMRDTRGKRVEMQSQNENQKNKAKKISDAVSPQSLWAQVMP